MKKNISVILLIILIELLFNGAIFAQGNNPPFPPNNTSAPLDINPLYILLGSLAFAGKYVYAILRKNKK